MYTASLDIDTITHGVCFLLGIFLLGIRDGQLSFEDQVRGQASVRVWRVMGVPVAKVSALCLGSEAMFLGREADLRAISPGEHVWESPRADFLLRLTL